MKMNSNKTGDKNSIVFFRHSVKALHIFALWKDSNHINIQQRNIPGAVVILIFGFALSASGFSGYFDLRSNGDIVEIHMTLILSLGILLVCTKDFAMWNSVGEIKQCLGWLQEFSRSFDNQTFIKHALKLYGMFFIIGEVTIMLTSIAFFCLPLTANTRVLPLATKNPTNIVDILQSPIYEILYFYQIVSTIFLGTCMIACDTLFCGTLLLLAAIFKTINALFEEVFLNGTENSMSDKEKEKVMIRIIESYIETTRLIEFVKETFMLISLGSLLFNVVITGVALYLVSLVPLNSAIFWYMVFALVFQIFQLGIYCFFGEAILTQNEKFRYNIYQCDWYNQSRSFKTMILLTLQRTENEPIITAGKLMPLCNETFAGILKMSYSLCTFLYTLKEAAI